MATTAIAFSPKEWKVCVQGETTVGTALHSAMFQLDVDSISMPSLNPTQVLDVRSSSGRTLKTIDVFTDNKLRVVEIGLSGRMHNDTSANGGHIHLLRNITDDASGDIAVAADYSPTGLVRAVTSVTATQFKSFTLAFIKPSSGYVDGGSGDTAKNMIFGGCQVSSFTLSADSGSEGGMYKWAATIQSGQVPELDSTDDLRAVVTAYASNTTQVMSSLTASQLNNVDVGLSSFSLNIDNPVVFGGTSTTGYKYINRGAECSVTCDMQVKYDDNTDEFINLYDAGTLLTDDSPLISQDATALDIDITNSIFTNVALSEGDIMMLDCSIKALSLSSTALVTINVS